MRADHHVDRAVGEPGERVAGLLVGLEPRQRAHLHGKAREALGEGLEVLLDQQGRRHQHRDLLAVLDRLERGAHRDLGLAEADVAREQPVHRDRLLHVGLDLIDRLQLVGRLGERERLFELALPRGVGSERVTLGRHARRVELDELDRDVAHRPARAALGLRPVAAAHLREGGRFAADVLREQVELIGGHVELVARVAALGRRVLEHEVLAHALDRVATAAGDLALGELDELADAVRGVHDVVARLQLQRVDDVAASRCELLHEALVAADRTPVELGLGEHRELRVRRLEPALELGQHDVRDAGLRWIEDARRPVAPRSRVLRAHRARARRGRLRMPRPRRASRRRAARRRARSHRRRCPGTTAPTDPGTRIAEPARDLEETLGRGIRLAGVECAERPPRDAVLTGRFAQRRQAHEVARAEVDGARRTGGRRAPSRLEELAVRLQQGDRAGDRPLGVDEGDRRSLRQVVDDGHDVVDERGNERLHALGRDALGHLLEHPADAGELVLQLPCAIAHGLGEQQLAARGKVDRRDLARQGALVGDREGADLVDLVAEELDAEGVVGDRREDVEDAAAQRELAAARDHVDAVVGEFDEPGRDLGEIVARARRRRGAPRRRRRARPRAAAARRARMR